MICVKLQYTNTHGEKFYFVSLGDPWPDRPGVFLVKRTTAKEERAKCFPDAEAAAAILVMIGNPSDWSIIMQDTDEGKPPLKLDKKT